MSHHIFIRSRVEHILHVSHLRRVPFRYVTVESAFFHESLNTPVLILSTHIRHHTRIPVRYRSVNIRRCPRRALAGDRSFGQTLGDESMPTAVVWDWYRRWW